MALLGFTEKRMGKCCQWEISISLAFVLYPQKNKLPSPLIAAIKMKITSTLSATTEEPKLLSWNDIVSKPGIYAPIIFDIPSNTFLIVNRKKEVFYYLCGVFEKADNTWGNYKFVEVKNSLIVTFDNRD